MGKDDKYKIESYGVSFKVSKEDYELYQKSFEAANKRLEKAWVDLVYSVIVETKAEKAVSFIDKVLNYVFSKFKK